MLPPQPFDGQIFIDFFRRKWTFNGSTKCWMKSGTVSDIPSADEFQPGLLTSELKRLLDGIPKRGGHFGIIAKPLLSLVPQNVKILYKDKIRISKSVESGTSIKPSLDNGRNLSKDQFVGKLLIFESGILKNKGFIIFDNTDNEIFVEGLASEAQKNDLFKIVDPTQLNPSGVLLGDIMLVSDSIDISCVDGEGLPLNNNAACNVDIIKCDDASSKPPGLDFKINQQFLDNLCVIVPGCKGPTGNRGEKGNTGADGTGGGPQGEQGDSGIDAPAVGDVLAGVEVVDIDDIFDTAIVATELDAENGVLNVIRAKIKTPNSNTPATQIISAPIERSIKFTNNDSFDYELLMPLTDPIGKTDIDILKYPRNYSIDQASQDTNVNKVKLSNFINKIIEVLEEKLDDINDAYNKQLKSYIESKDESARSILADLAHQLSECEWELPIDFCLGIGSDCNADEEGGFSGSSFTYPFASTLFGTTSSTGNESALDMGTYSVPPRTIGQKTAVPKVVESKVSIYFPSADSELSTTSLPPGGYVIQYVSGAIKSSATDWIVGSEIESTGLQINVTDGSIFSLLKMPEPTVEFNALEKSSVELAYREAPLEEKAVAVEIVGESGSISLEAPLPGINPQGEITVRVLKVDL